MEEPKKRDSKANTKKRSSKAEKTSVSNKNSHQPLVPDAGVDRNTLVDALFTKKVGNSKKSADSSGL